MSLHNQLRTATQDTPQGCGFSSLRSRWQARFHIAGSLSVSSHLESHFFPRRMRSVKGKLCIFFHAYGARTRKCDTAFISHYSPFHLRKSATLCEPHMQLLENKNNTCGCVPASGLCRMCKSWQYKWSLLPMCETPRCRFLRRLVDRQTPQIAAQTPCGRIAETIFVHEPYDHFFFWWLPLSSRGASARKNVIVFGAIESKHNLSSWHGLGGRAQHIRQRDVFETASMGRAAHPWCKHLWVMCLCSCCCKSFRSFRHSRRVSS